MFFLYVCKTYVAKLRVTIMSDQVIQSNLLEELSTEEQELLSGGKRDYDYPYDGGRTKQRKCWCPKQTGYPYPGMGYGDVN
jgi:hypothetical protein